MSLNASLRDVTVHVNNARLNTRVLSARAGFSCGLAAIFLLAGANALQNAVAEGDTRTITMHHMHTSEDITITYKRNGQYDEAALEKLNWFLRDWRKSEQTRMDPHLIDLVWDVQREANTGNPIQVVCGYRSPETNAMLRHRSANTGVARFSQHMLGHAMDFYIPGISLEKVREIGLRMQRGGVGFYPTSGSPFVHMDTADIRMWPRMSREELARVFPDGRTVQIPSDGRPMPGYAVALADVRKHGGMPSANSIGAARANGVDIDVDTLVASNDRPRANPFAKLLGLGVKDEEDEEETVASAAPTAAPAAWNSAPGVAQTSAPQQAIANVPMPPKRPVLAAIARGAQVAEKATVAAAVKVADAAASVKFVRTADAASLPTVPQAPVSAPAPTQSASPSVVAQSLAPPSATRAPLQPSLPTQPAAGKAPTANQVIAERGYWQGPADGTIVANPGAAKLARGAQANKDMTTGAIGPFVNPNAKAGSGLALAYADPSSNMPVQAAASQAAPMGALQAPAQAAQPISVQTVSVPPAPQGDSSGTTVALKRSGNQASSTVMAASSSSVTVVKADPRFGNPWMRAIVLSPSVHRFLTTIALGVGDLRSLAAMMVKPSSAVFTTFATDPNPGLDHDHFAGSAIVFLPTVNYPGRAAAMQ
jgi:uncharacterized protein YcbK (DUF882 family)